MLKTQSQDGAPVIRAATVADAAAVAILARQLLDHELALNEYAGRLTPWAATAEELRKQILQPNTCFFIAECDGELVGYVKAVIFGRRPHRREIGHRRWLREVIEVAARRLYEFLMRRPRPNVETIGGYIAGVFVRPEARRRSLGRALIAAAEDWFRNQGIVTSELHVLYANESARRFWEKAGYQPVAMGMRKRL